MKALTNEQHDLVILLCMQHTSRERERIAMELQEVSRSSDGDLWLEEIDRTIRGLWAQLNGVEE
jgi:hypothetical protein